MRLKISFLVLFTASWCVGQTNYASVGRMLTLEELMDTTITVATGTQKKVAEAPSIATVITEEQIARSSATTLFELLDSVPGLFVYMNYYSSSNIDIRGIHTTHGAQVVWLINGTSMKRIQNSNLPIRFNLPTSVIERIEIIRGPGSAVYGADAFSGVINIITKNAKSLEDIQEAGVRYGSFGTSEVFASTGANIGEAKIGANISYATEGKDSGRVMTKDQQSVFDKAYGTHASYAPGALENRGRWLTLALNGTYKDFEMNFFGQLARDLGTGTGNSAALDPRGHYDSNHAQLDLIYKTKLASDIELENKLFLAYMAQRSRLYLFPAGALLPIGKDGNAFSTPNVGKVLFTDGYIGSPCPTEYNVGLESALLVSKFNDHLLRASGGFKYINAKFEAYKNFGPGVIDGKVSPINGALTDVTGTPYIYIPNNTRKMFFVSLQDEINLAPQWTLTAGVRDDYYSDFGNTLNPRVALVWNKESHLSVKFMYGRAFRAPSFQELYMQNNPSGIGNINVKPETIDMREIGVDYRPNNKWHVGLNIYDYTADKLIGTVPVAAGTTQAANVGKQLGRGVETIFQYEPMEKMLLTADYAYRWTKNSATGKAVVDVPIHVGHLRADWEFFARGVLMWETQVVANTTRAANDTRQKIGDYAVSNLSVGYDPTKQTNIKFSVRNIFDKEYYYPMTTANLSDIPAPSRSVYLQATYRF